MRESLITLTDANLYLDYMYIDEMSHLEVNMGPSDL